MAKITVFIIKIDNENDQRFLVNAFQLGAPEFFVKNGDWWTAFQEARAKAIEFAEILSGKGHVATISCDFDPDYYDTKRTYTHFIEVDECAFRATYLIGALENTIEKKDQQIAELMAQINAKPISGDAHQYQPIAAE